MNSLKYLLVTAISFLIAGYAPAQTIEISSDFPLTGWYFLLPDSTGASDLGLDAVVQVDTNGVGNYTVKNIRSLQVKFSQRGENLSEHVKFGKVVVSEDKDSTARYFIFYIPTEIEREYPAAYWDKIFTREKLYKRRIKREAFLRKLGYDF